MRLAGIDVDALDEAQVCRHIMAALDHGEGGHVVTPNIDILAQARDDAAMRQLLTAASLCVPDGTPLLWASRLIGNGLPERVPGSSLIFSLSDAAAGSGRTVYLLGGAPGVPRRAAESLASRSPGLVVAGYDCPRLGFDRTEEGLQPVRSKLVAASPDLVFVGLGFPKQERVIARLRKDLPEAWFIGCGAAIPFAAGEVRRAPGWMQRAGLEWTHRLATEPRRLAGRYLMRDMPFAVRLLTGAAMQRVRTRQAASP